MQRAPSALVVVQAKGRLWFGVHQTRLLRKIFRRVRDEVTGEQEGLIMIIKFLVNTKDACEGKVLTWVDCLTTCFCSAAKPVLAGSYALLVVARLHKAGGEENAT